MADSSWLGVGGTRNVAVATKDRSECPERAHDHPSNSGRSATPGEVLISPAKSKIRRNSSSVMFLGMLEILKVRGGMRGFFVQGREAALHSMAKANIRDRIVVTTAATVMSISISGIIGSLNPQ